MLRLFVAIELPDAVRDVLVSAMASLREAGVGEEARWVRPESVHLTLKFLGAVDEANVPAMHTALRLGVRDAAPFELRTGALGSFGGRRNLRVIWAGVDGDTAALAALAARVEAALAPLGFETERRPFAAHLTLARIRETATPPQREHVYDAIARVAAPASVPFTVERVSLMRSTLGPGGAVYDALASYPLESGV